MAGDPFKRVQDGQRLVIPAAAYNAFVDAAKAHQRDKLTRGRAPGDEFRQSGIVLVRNDSGFDLGRFSVLGIDGVVVAPEDNPQQFFETVCLTGVEPDEVDHKGKFLILCDPLRDGAIGRAWIDGVCPARIEVLDEDHKTADVKPDDASELRSAGTAGAAQILYKESGTGSKLAVVRLGPARPPAGDCVTEIEGKTLDDLDAPTPTTSMYVLGIDGDGCLVKFAIEECE